MLRTFAQNFWAEPWKLPSKYAEQGFQEKSIFENLGFTVFPRFGAEISDFKRLVSSRIPNYPFLVPKEALEGTSVWNLSFIFTEFKR